MSHIDISANLAGVNLNHDKIKPLREVSRLINTEVSDLNDVLFADAQPNTLTEILEYINNKFYNNEAKVMLDFLMTCDKAAVVLPSGLCNKF